jgi:hypothetical protein
MSEEANAGGNEGGGEGTGTTPTWMASMPDAFKTNEGFAQFGEAADAYAKFDELLKADGNALHIPGEDATPEDKEAFALKMGRPEKADGYEIGKPEGWPENIPYDEGLDTNFKEVAFEMGLSADKAANLHKWYNETQLKTHNEIIAAEKAAVEKADNDLKDLWKGDEFKVNTEIAHRAFKQFGGEEAAEFLDNTVVNGVALADNPVFRKLFYEVGKAIGDDGANVGQTGLGGELTDEQKAEQRFPNTKFPKT